MPPNRAFVGVAILCAQIAISAHAEDRSNYDEPGIQYGRDYLNQHVAENIDPFTGNLMIQQTDLSISGPAGFDLAIHRAYNSSTAAGSASATSPFGRGWDIHFGRVSHAPGQTCAAAAAQSMNLETADGSKQTLHRANGAGYTLGSDYLTTTLWKAQCASGGIVVFAPNGTKYEMTEDDGQYWHANRVSDRFGNSFTVSYVFNATAGRKVITQLLANDGRAITFNYAGSRLSTMGFPQDFGHFH